MSGTEKLKKAAEKAKEIAQSEQTQAAIGQLKSAATSAPAKTAYKWGGIVAAGWVGLSALFGTYAAVTADNLDRSATGFVASRFGIDYAPSNGNCFYVHPTQEYEVSYYTYDTNAFWETFKDNLPFFEGQATRHSLGTVGMIEEAPCEIIKDSITVFNTRAAANDYSLSEGQRLLQAAGAAEMQQATADKGGFIAYRTVPVGP